VAGRDPEVHARLRTTPPACVADLACGSAWSSIAIARAYPDVTVDAVDVDVASIETARANIAAAGLTDRIRPTAHDASDAHLDGRYDLVTIFEALHDMNHLVEALRTARAGLAEGGSVVIGDERVADRFTTPGRPARALQLRLEHPALPHRRHARRGLGRNRDGAPRRRPPRLRR
jgi:predicted O-methyltransferase YrrM